VDWAILPIMHAQDIVNLAEPKVSRALLLVWEAAEPGTVSRINRGLFGGESILLNMGSLAAGHFSSRALLGQYGLKGKAADQYLKTGRFSHNILMACHSPELRKNHELLVEMRKSGDSFYKPKNSNLRVTRKGLHEGRKRLVRKAADSFK
jgi:hypothetical protein